MEPDERNFLGLTAAVVASFLKSNEVDLQALPDLVRSVHGAFMALNGASAAPVSGPRTPAVPIKRSVKPDYLICLEDGKQLKMLKRYLRIRYDLSPEEYRRRWGLPPDYPMVAPNYSEHRSASAKSFGLGRGARGGGTRPKT